MRAAATASVEDPWVRAMRGGDFERAWEISDAVLHARAGRPCSHWPRHYQYIWNGTPLDSQRVLIRCYHGLGDTVQFVRYAPLVRAVAREVIVWAQVPLLPLLRTAEGIDRLLPLHDGAPEVDYDVDVETMELPHVFRSTLETLPAALPYFHVANAAPVLGPGINVGLVWCAGDWDDRRSIPFRALRSLLAVRGVTFHVLQRGAAVHDWPAGFGVVSGRDDIVETAALMRALDLVITIDSFPAHLAGALAVPTWTLLQAEPDWRWMREREDSPWYPTMRLFRQEQPGEWEPVIANVAHALSAWARDRRSGRSVLQPVEVSGRGRAG
jgi:hypothetical protein